MHVLLPSKILKPSSCLSWWWRPRYIAMITIPSRLTTVSQVLNSLTLSNSVNAINLDKKEIQCMSNCRAYRLEFYDLQGVHRSVLNWDWIATSVARVNLVNLIYEVNRGFLLDGFAIAFRAQLYIFHRFLVLSFPLRRVCLIFGVGHPNRWKSQPLLLRVAKLINLFLQRIFRLIVGRICLGPSANWVDKSFERDTIRYASVQAKRLSLFSCSVRYWSL